jgi:hypothetical protein
MSTKTAADGYGRVTKTQLTTDPEAVDYTDTAYDALGRTASVSNPYRSTSNGITTYAHDALGGTTLVGEPDSSILTTGYSGSATTVTDEVGKKKKSQADAFGRVTAVWEDPAGLNYETDYTNDVLGDLNCSHNRSLSGFRSLFYLRRWESRNPTPPTSAQADGIRIHGIGRRWRSWWGTPNRPLIIVS